MPEKRCVFEEMSGQNASFSASVSFRALELAGSGPVRPNLDADHAKEADLSWSTASSEAVTNLKQQSGNKPH
jgi:hypothetical protein